MVRQPGVRGALWLKGDMKGNIWVKRWRAGHYGVLKALTEDF